MSSKLTRSMLALTLALVAATGVLVHQLRVQARRADSATRVVSSLAREVAELRQESPPLAEPMTAVNPAPSTLAIEKSPASGDDASPGTYVAGASSVGKWVAADANLVTRQLYAPLLEQFSVTPQQKEELISLLAAEREAATSTPHHPGSEPAIHERTDKIAAVIGYENVQLLEIFESKLVDYGQAQKLGAELATAGYPITSNQREQLVDLLASERARTTRDAQLAAARSAKDLEKAMQRKNEYEHRVLEGAGVFLSQDQIKLLESVYATRSARRAMAVDAQQQRASGGRGSGTTSLWYPPDQ